MRGPPALDTFLVLGTLEVGFAATGTPFPVTGEVTGLAARRLATVTLPRRIAGVAVKEKLTVKALTPWSPRHDSPLSIPKGSTLARSLTGGLYQLKKTKKTGRIVLTQVPEEDAEEYAEEHFQTGGIAVLSERR